MLTATDAVEPPSAQVLATGRALLNIAHRGASGLAPEHTDIAAALARRQGSDYLELDVQMSRDGVLVVVHDTTLDRTGRGPAEDCTGPVRSKTLAQLKRCDVGRWFNEAYPDRARAYYAGCRIQTVEEIFRRWGRTWHYYIELKDPEAAPGIEEALLRLMHRYGLRDGAGRRWQVLVQSFSAQSLRRFHALDPAMPLIQLYPTLGSTAVRATLDAVRAYAVGVGPTAGDVDASLVDAAHERRLAVHPYTVNAPSEMERLISLDVDGMFTDYPGRLNALLPADAAPAPAARRLTPAIRGAVPVPRPIPVSGPTGAGSRRWHAGVRVRCRRSVRAE